MQWGNPDTIQKILVNGGSNDETLKDIHFERWVVKIPVLSPNHYWTMMSTKSDLAIQAIQTIMEPSKLKPWKKMC